MVGVFVSVIVCSLHIPEKNHIGMTLSAAHMCVSAQEMLDRFWWNFVSLYAIEGHPRLVHFSFLHLLAELWQMHHVPQLKWCNFGKHWKHIGHMNSSNNDDSNHSKVFYMYMKCTYMQMCIQSDQVQRTCKNCGVDCNFTVLFKVKMTSGYKGSWFV